MEPNIQTPKEEIKFSEVPENQIGFTAEKNNDPLLILASVSDNQPNSCCNDTVIQSYQPAPLILYPPSANAECNALRNDICEEDKAPACADIKGPICEEDVIPVSDQQFLMIKYSRIFRIVIVIKILLSALYLAIFPPLTPILLFDFGGWYACRSLSFNCLMLYSLFNLVCSFGCVVSTIIIGSWASDVHSAKQRPTLFYLTGILAFFAFLNGIISHFIYQYVKKSINLTKAQILDIRQIMLSKRLPFFKFNKP
jgi:hypothetical protein